MKTYIINILAALALVSCANHIDIEELRYPEKTSDQKAFELEFTELYGEVSKDIVWMTVSSEKVSVDLSQLEGEYKLQVFTANPCEDLSYCYLLAEYAAKGGEVKEIEYDYPTGLNRVFVSAIGSNGETFTKAIEVKNDTEIAYAKTDADETFYTHEPMRYRVAYEGYTGDNLDFDYNDAVLEIEYVRGREQAKVNVLAAGSACATKVVLRRTGLIDKGDEEVLFEEIHEALGFKGWYDYAYERNRYVILNTGMNESKEIGKTSFELKEDLNASVANIAAKIFVYFTYPSEKKGKGDEQSISNIPLKPGTQYPQGLLIADPTWKWTMETMRLSASYSLFRFWIAEPSEYPLWYGGTNWKIANNYVQ